MHGRMKKAVVVASMVWAMGAPAYADVEAVGVLTCNHVANNKIESCYQRPTGEVNCIRVHAAQLSCIDVASTLCNPGDIAVVKVRGDAAINKDLSCNVIL